MKSDAKIVEVFTEMAPNYEQVVDSELNRFWGWSYQGFVNKLIESTPINKDDIVLDVATGTGVLSKRLEIEGLPRNRIHGLDITMSMLRHAKKRFESIEYANGINHVCASAMEIPYVNGIFSKVICGLASHHMNAKILASESYRVLAQEGTLSIIDAGGSLLWKIPGVKLIIKLAAFVYFSLAENNSRAWLEADAVSNVISKDEWIEVLAKTGFQNIEIVKLNSKYFWVPAPLLIKAIKTNGGRSIEQLV